MAGSANWDKPVTTDLYTDVLAIIKARDEDLALMFNGTTPTGTIPTNAVKWDGTAHAFKKWNGSSWVDLDTSYSINVTTLGGAAAASYALLASPTFTGDPKAPTPATGDNDTSIATTAFVKNQAYAPIASPTFTGVPLSTTPSPGDSSTKIATTAFVAGAMSGAIPTGTKVAFYQSTAPSGWTIDTNAAFNNAAIRLVTSGGGTSGGADLFSSVFTTGRVTDGHAVSAAELPAHTHTGTTDNDSPDHVHTGSTGGRSAGHVHNTSATSGRVTDVTDYSWTGSTRSAGAGVSGSNMVTGGESVDHSHSFTSNGASARHQHTFTTGNGPGSGTAHTHGISAMNIKYANFIVCTKN